MKGKDLSEEEGKDLSEEEGRNHVILGKDQIQARAKHDLDSNSRSSTRFIRDIKPNLRDIKPYISDTDLFIRDTDLFMS